MPFLGFIGAQIQHRIKMYSSIQREKKLANGWLWFRATLVVRSEFLEEDVIISRRITFSF